MPRETLSDYFEITPESNIDSFPEGTKVAISGLVRDWSYTPANKLIPEDSKGSAPMLPYVWIGDILCFLNKTHLRNTYLKSLQPRELSKISRMLHNKEITLIGEVVERASKVKSNNGHEIAVHNIVNPPNIEDLLKQGKTDLC